MKYSESWQRRLPAKGLMRLLAALSLLAMLTTWAQAFDVQAARGAVAQAAQDFTDNGSDYEYLLELRNRVEGLRDEARERLHELDPRRAELEQLTTQLGPASSTEAPALAEQRKALTEQRGAFETEYRQVLLVVEQSDRLWSNIIQRRREVFSQNLFAHVSSPLDPGFWHYLFTVQLPHFGAQVQMLAQRVAAHVEQHSNLESELALVCAFLIAVCAFAWLHRVLAGISRRSRKSDESVSHLAAFRRGAIVLLMRSIPLPAAMLLFNVVVRRIDLLPVDFDDWLMAIVVGLLVAGATRGAMGALLAPNAPNWRILRARNSTASIVYKLTVRCVDVFTVGIIFARFQDLVDTLIGIEISSIEVLSAVMIALCVIALRRLSRASHDASEPSHGFVQLKLSGLRPLLGVVTLATALCLIFGYVALAGFITGRAVISAIAVATTIFCVSALNHLFDQGLASDTAAGRSIAQSLGFEPQTIDFAVTFLSGILRFVMIAVTGMILLMPWGLRYGEVNPFDDLSIFFTTSDLRGWLGSFGFAVLAFVLGLSGTRLTVGWLDTSLLPRTSLDSSIRHSVRTILSYAGFLATFLVTLSLMGINAQNVAVVAGALSVGIGFGLQSIVSNFVSGLIVLAERPVRVGDVVVVKGEEGRIQKISVRSTLIGTGEQSSLIVPNSDLLTSIVKNRTLADPMQQLRLNLLLAHDSDPAQVSDIVLPVASQHPHVIAEPKPRLLFMRVSELGHDYELRCTIDRFENVAQVRSDLHCEIVPLLRAAGIRFSGAAS